MLHGAKLARSPGMLGLRMCAGVACLAAMLVMVACLERPTDSLAAGDEGGAIGVELAAYSLAPAQRDVLLCRQLAGREQGCFLDPNQTEADAGQLAACATRFACSRRMWREDVVDAVYACLPQRPCEDSDPAASCLAQAVDELGESPAERKFAEALLTTEQECPDLMQVASGQADAVYKALTNCLQQQRSCDAMGQCAGLVMQELVSEICDDRGPNGAPANSDANTPA